MTELSLLISKLQAGVQENASYIKTIRHPRLLIASLQELEQLIGNDNVKESVADQISHLIMMKDLVKKNRNMREDDVMLNTVLYGPPGVGKTLIGAKLAKIWYSLGYLDGTRNTREKKAELGDMLKDFLKENGVNGGSGSDDALLLYIMFVFVMIFITVLSMAWSFYSRFGGLWTAVVIVLLVVLIVIVGCYLNSLLSSDNQNDQNNKNTSSSYFSPREAEQMILPSDDQIIRVVTRADFVDRYVGWSDKKTNKLLEESLGKVLFVDEAYSLLTDVHDSFGMEVITALNLFLSQHSREIIVIFAGYKDLMENGIFSSQPGLKRRFMWQFDCNGYNDDQMFQIFHLQLRKKGWDLTDPEETRQIFHRNRTAFPAFGGDTEKLTFFAELEYSRDFLRSGAGMEAHHLTPDHVSRGLLKLKQNNIESRPDEPSSNPLANMMKLLQGKKGEADLSSLLRNQERSYH